MKASNDQFYVYRTSRETGFGGVFFNIPPYLKGKGRCLIYNKRHFLINEFSFDLNTDSEVRWNQLDYNENYIAYGTYYISLNLIEHSGVVHQFNTRLTLKAV